MNDEEKEILELLERAWRKFVILPQKDGGYPYDDEEFRILIHACQNVVASRTAYRIMAKERIP